jgi:hypothetical protein
MSLGCCSWARPLAIVIGLPCILVYADETLDRFDPNSLLAILHLQETAAQRGGAGLDKALAYARRDPEASAPVLGTVAVDAGLPTQRRMLAVFLLGQLGSGKPAETLRELTAAHDLQIRFAALMALAASSPQPPWAFEVFASAASDVQDPMIAQGGVTGLLRSQDRERAETQLLGLYASNHTSELLRIHIGKALIKRGVDVDRSVVTEVLSKRLADPRLPEFQKMNTAGDLVAFGDTSAVHHLLDGLDRPGTRATAYWKLRELAPAGPTLPGSDQSIVTEEAWRKTAEGWRKWDFRGFMPVQSGAPTESTRFHILPAGTQPAHTISTCPTP